MEIRLAGGILPASSVPVSVPSLPIVLYFPEHRFSGMFYIKLMYWETIALYLSCLMNTKYHHCQGQGTELDVLF